MKIKLNSDMITGAIFLVVSIILYGLIPSQIKTYEKSSITAASFPTLLLRIMIVCSAILLAQGILSKGKKEYCLSAALFRNESLKRLKPVIYIAMLLVYAVLLPRIGFIIASLLLVNGILAYFRSRTWYFYAIASANVFLAYFAFRAINVTLP